VWECIETANLEKAAQLVEALRSLKDPNIAGRLEGTIKGLARAYYNRGRNVHYHGGGYAETIGDYEAAVRVDTGYARAFSDLAYLQAVCPTAEFRDAIKAVKNATKSCELTSWKDCRYIATLAAVYAEVSDFASAVKWQKEAIGLLPEKERTKWQRNYELRLKLYESGKPYHMGNLWSFSTGEMVAWWKFDDGSGTVLTDSSGNGYDGTILGNPTWKTGSQYGGSGYLDFDGSDDYVDVNYLPDAFLFPAQYTVSAWFRADGGSYRDIFSAFDVDEGHGILIELRSSNDLPPGGLRYVHRSPLGISNQQINESIYTTTGYSDGLWHHVAVVRESDTSRLVYVDGQVAASDTNATSVLDEPVRVFLGQLRPSNMSRWWNGGIDDVRIYNYALSEAEIKAMYEDGKPPLKKVSNE
jgi:hypothetical protein